MDYARLRELLSAERLGSYLDAADGDLKRAFALYDWNIEASAAALSLAAVVGVVVRNALDAQAQAWARSRGGGDWLTGAPADDRARADIQEARARAARGGRQATRGQVVAELNLGFWRFLVLTDAEFAHDGVTLAEYVEGRNDAHGEDQACKRVWLVCTVSARFGRAGALPGLSQPLDGQDGVRSWPPVIRPISCHGVAATPSRRMAMTA